MGRDRQRGGIVEIAIPAAKLGALATSPLRNGLWVPVLIELARYAERGTNSPNGNTGDAGGMNRRMPGASLRRLVQQRDRQCVHPACRAPARAVDQDHRIDYAVGGTTTGDNLEPECRHDHRLKHDGGWQIDQPEPGLTIWTSALGHRYESRPPPVIPRVPEPYPDGENRWPMPAGYLVWDTSPSTCQCDTPCECERPILPPMPRRMPADAATIQARPPVFDPDDRPPF